jgi:glycosyltransferase involved in cell wall biosynthesis
MQQKKKILILAYFYLPCNLTAAQRVYGWIKYLYEFGYYPIVVTRNWSNCVANPNDIYKNSGNALYIEKYETHEVHYLPYKSGLRDRIFTKFFNTPLVILSKLLTALEIFSMGVTNIFIPHANIYSYAKRMLKIESGIHKMIASAKPFDIFKFAYLLNKEFNISWIADYRDPWNTQHEDLKKASLAERFGFNQPYLERKWIKSASIVMTVSNTLLNQICAFNSKNGEVIMNGFMEEDYPFIQKETRQITKELIFTHIGSLPSIVKVDVFINGIKRLIDKFSDQLSIKVEYIGVCYIPATAEMIKKQIKGYESHFILTERITRNEVMEKQHRTDIFYMAGHEYKGYPSSKIYEYVGSGKPVVLCPSDHDIMEQTLVSTGQAIICNTVDEVVGKLSPLIESYIYDGKIPVTIDTNARMRYTRKNQVQKLANLLDSLK